jgi:hypothetical protein
MVEQIEVVQPLAFIARAHWRWHQGSRFGEPAGLRHTSLAYFASAGASAFRAGHPLS